MFKAYLLNPPHRTVQQLAFRSSSGDYQGKEEAPNFEYLKKTGIPIWTYRIGEQYPLRITVLFSHGNTYDVPKIFIFLANLFDKIVEICQVCVTLVLWDYPGFSFSPYSTSDFALMEDHIKRLVTDLTMGDLSQEFQIENDPLFLMGHSIGGSLQTVLCRETVLRGRIKGYFCIAPFYSLKDMSKNYFLGSVYFDTFLTKYAGFCNVELNVKNRVDHETLVMVVLCISETVTTSGSWALAKFSELLGSSENVIMIEGQHNSPITDKHCHENIAHIFKGFLLKSSIMPPEME